MLKSKDQFRKALNKDFRNFYVNGYTTDWREQRLVRELEIDIMLFDNAKEYIDLLLAQAKRIKELEPNQNYENGYRDGYQAAESDIANRREYE